MNTVYAIAIFLIGCLIPAQAAENDEAPRSAVLITSCHQIVTVVMVTPDDRIVVFDSSSGVPADAVKALAAKSAEPARVYELGCYLEQEQEKDGHTDA